MKWTRRTSAKAVTEKTAQYYTHLETAALKVWSGLMEASPTRTYDDEQVQRGYVSSTEAEVRNAVHGKVGSSNTVITKLKNRPGTHYWSLKSNVRLTSQESVVREDITGLLASAIHDKFGYKFEESGDKPFIIPGTIIVRTDGHAQHPWHVIQGKTQFTLSLNSDLPRKKAGELLKASEPEITEAIRRNISNLKTFASVGIIEPVLRR